MKKKIVSLLVAVMMIGAVIGCGGSPDGEVSENGTGADGDVKDDDGAEENTAENEEKHEPVTLHYYIAGFADQEDADKVYEEVNKLIQEIYPWISVEFHVSNQADYATHLALAQTGGDPIDIIGTFGTAYQTEMANGSYMDVTEYLDDYPDLMSALPDFAYDWGVMNGKTYGFPNWQQCNYANQAITIDKEIADQYELDIDKVNELIQAEEFFNPVVYDVLGEFVERAKAGGADNLFVNGSGNALTVQTRGYEQLTGPIYFAISDENSQLLNIWETDQVREYLEAMSEYREAGYIPEDISTNDIYNPGNVKANGLYGLSFGGNAYVPNFPELRLAAWGRDLYFMPTQISEDQYYIGYSYAAGLTTVGATSEYPEDALRVIELLYTNEELQNMLVYGLEGEHYTKNEDGTITTLEYDSGQADAQSSYGMYKFSLGNSALTWINQSFDQEMYDWAFKTLPETSVVSNLIGFAPDTSKVSSKLGQINAIVTEYSSQLLYMDVEDWEATYTEFLSKLESAGINDVIAELQTQVDAFLASK